MQYTEAFEALGYALPSPRQDWSAINENGVCLSLWRTELATLDRVPWFDTKRHGRPIDLWGFKPGNKLRIEHIQAAISDFDSFVDVVLVSGLPGGSYEDASPWVSSQRRARWRILTLDSQTGHFATKVIPD